MPHWGPRSIFVTEASWITTRVFVRGERFLSHSRDTSIFHYLFFLRLFTSLMFWWFFSFLLSFGPIYQFSLLSVCSLRVGLRPWALEGVFPAAVELPGPWRLREQVAVRLGPAHDRKGVGRYALPFGPCPSSLAIFWAASRVNRGPFFWRPHPADTFTVRRLR